jgi:hypothetical protein
VVDHAVRVLPGVKALLVSSPKGRYTIATSRVKTYSTLTFPLPIPKVSVGTELMGEKKAFFLNVSSSAWLSFSSGHRPAHSDHHGGRPCARESPRRPGIRSSSPPNVSATMPRAASSLKIRRAGSGLASRRGPSLLPYARAIRGDRSRSVAHILWWRTWRMCAANAIKTDEGTRLMFIVEH